MFSWFQKFPKKSYVDIQLCSLQNAFSREAAFQILRTKYQIRSLEELINPSIGTMSMRCHEKFPDRSINPFSRRQFLCLCKTRFMKDAAVYRFAIEGSFDQISKHKMTKMTKKTWMSSSTRSHQTEMALMYDTTILQPFL